MDTFDHLKTFSQKAVEGHVVSKGIVIEPFSYAEQNGYHKILIGRL